MYVVLCYGMSCSKSKKQITIFISLPANVELALYISSHANWLKDIGNRENKACNMRALASIVCNGEVEEWMGSWTQVIF